MRLGCIVAALAAPAWAAKIVKKGAAVKQSKPQPSFAPANCSAWDDTLQPSRKRVDARLCGFAEPKHQRFAPPESGVVRDGFSRTRAHERMRALARDLLAPWRDGIVAPSASFSDISEGPVTVEYAIVKQRAYVRDAAGNRTARPWCQSCEEMMPREARRFRNFAEIEHASLQVRAAPRGLCGGALGARGAICKRIGGLLRVVGGLRGGRRPSSARAEASALPRRAPRRDVATFELVPNRSRRASSPARVAKYAPKAATRNGTRPRGARTPVKGPCSRTWPASTPGTSRPPSSWRTSARPAASGRPRTWPRAMCLETSRAKARVPAPWATGTCTRGASARARRAGGARASPWPCFGGAASGAAGTARRRTWGGISFRAAAARGSSGTVARGAGLLEGLLHAGEATLDARRG